MGVEVNDGGSRLTGDGGGVVAGGILSHAALLPGCPCDGVVEGDGADALWVGGVEGDGDGLVLIGDGGAVSQVVHGGAAVCDEGGVWGAWGAVICGGVENMGEGGAVEVEAGVEEA